MTEIMTAAEWRIRNTKGDTRVGNRIDANEQIMNNLAKYLSDLGNKIKTYHKEYMIDYCIQNEDIKSSEPIKYIGLLREPCRIPMTITVNGVIYNEDIDFVVNRKQKLVTWTNEDVKISTDIASKMVIGYFYNVYKNIKEIHGEEEEDNVSENA